MRSPSDEETSSQIKQTTPSKFCFPDEVGPSNVPPNTNTPSTPRTDTTNVTITPSSDNLYTDTFGLALSKIFSSTLRARLTSKVAILKAGHLSDCVKTDNEDRCRQISPYIHGYWKDLRKKNRCVCVEDRTAIRNSIKYAYIEAIHATHPGSWVMTDIAVHAWWPFMHRYLPSKMAKRNPCVKIDKKT